MRWRRKATMQNTPREHSRNNRQPCHFTSGSASLSEKTSGLRLLDGGFARRGISSAYARVMATGPFAFNRAVFPVDDELRFASLRFEYRASPLALHFQLVRSCRSCRGRSRFARGLGRRSICTIPARRLKSQVSADRRLARRVGGAHCAPELVPDRRVVETASHVTG